MSRPIVSVCIITSNGRDVIESAVRSALMQQGDVDFEIVIGDDASTDGTAAIVRQLAAANPGRVRVLTTDRPAGPVINFMRTYAACDGEFVALLEDGDLWTDPLKLLKQVSGLAHNPACSISAHRVTVTYAADVPVYGRWEGDAFPKQPLAHIEPGDIFFRKYAVRPSSVVFRNRLIESFPAWVQEFGSYDWPLEMLLGAQGNLLYLDQEMAVYRVRGNGRVTTNPSLIQFPQALDMLNAAADHFGGQYRRMLMHLTAEIAEAWADALFAAGQDERVHVLTDIVPNRSVATQQQLTAALRPHQDAKRRRLIWHDDAHLTVGDTNFVLTADGAELQALQSDAEGFVLGKSKSMIQMVCAHTESLNVRRICEIGIFKGGSAALYDALFEPEQLVAIDYASDRQPQLDAYIRSHRREGVLHPHYGVNQADPVAMNAILRRHFPNRDIDVIVDDASHYYAETRAAFNIAFPFLKPGGLYVIEDWGWAHWPGDAWQRDGGVWRDKIALSNLCFELVILCASAPHLISEITVRPAMFIVRRGSGALADLEGAFDIGGHTLARGKAISPQL